MCIRDRLINYPVREQLVDLAPYFCASVMMAGAAYLLKFVLPFGDVGMLLCQGTMAMASYFLFSLLFKLDALTELKLISGSLLNNLKNGK
jgi:hypothetical protein